MYYGSNSAFLRSVTGRKLTLSSNYVSIRSVYDFSISICYYIPLYHTWHFLYLFVWRGFMEANTYHPILNISVVPRRYFSFTDLMFTVHSTITIIGSIDTYINVAKMSQKALHCIALPAMSSTYYFQEPSSCRISSTPTTGARFPSEAGCLSLSANNLKQTYFE